MSDPGRLGILHDHYKESFALIRERERHRDRTFLILLGLFALLILEVGYPAQFGGSLDSASVAAGEVDLDALPLAALLSATWVFTMAIALRYCQLSITVERSYDYLHRLEDSISPLLGDNGVYRREGKFYLNRYPPLLNVSWILYGYGFPAIIAIAIVWLLVGEWMRLDYPAIHKLFDTAIGVTILVTLYLYRVHPTLMRHAGG